MVVMETTVVAATPHCLKVLLYGSEGTIVGETCVSASSSVDVFTCLRGATLWVWSIGWIYLYSVFLFLYMCNCVRKDLKSFRCSISTEYIANLTHCPPFSVGNTSLLNQGPRHSQSFNLTEYNNSHPSRPLLISTQLATEQNRLRWRKAERY